MDEKVKIHLFRLRDYDGDKKWIAYSDAGKLLHKGVPREPKITVLHVAWGRMLPDNKRPWHEVVHTIRYIRVCSPSEVAMAMADVIEANAKRIAAEAAPNCGEADGGPACILTKGHDGRHSNGHRTWRAAAVLAALVVLLVGCSLERGDDRPDAGSAPDGELHADAGPDAYPAVACSVACGPDVQIGCYATYDYQNNPEAGPLQCKCAGGDWCLMDQCPVSPSPPCSTCNVVTGSGEPIVEDCSVDGDCTCNDAAGKWACQLDECVAAP